jgi:hypothetical protein
MTEDPVKFLLVEVRRHSTKRCVLLPAFTALVLLLQGALASGASAASFTYQVSPLGGAPVESVGPQGETLHPSWTTTPAEQAKGVCLEATIRQGLAHLYGLGDESGSGHVGLCNVAGTYLGADGHYDVQVSSAYPGLVKVYFAICVANVCAGHDATVVLKFTGQDLNWGITMRAEPKYSKPKVPNELAVTTINAYGAVTTNVLGGHSGRLTGGVARVNWLDTYLSPLPDFSRTLNFPVTPHRDDVFNGGFPARSFQIPSRLFRNVRGLWLLFFDATLSSSDDQHCPAGSHGILAILQGARTPDRVISMFCGQIRMYVNDPRNSDSVKVWIDSVKQTTGTIA